MGIDLYLRRVAFLGCNYERSGRGIAHDQTNVSTLAYFIDAYVRRSAPNG